MLTEGRIRKKETDRLARSALYSTHTQNRYGVTRGRPSLTDVLPRRLERLVFTLSGRGSEASCRNTETRSPQACTEYEPPGTDSHLPHLNPFSIPWRQREPAQAQSPSLRRHGASPPPSLLPPRPFHLPCSPHSSQHTHASPHQQKASSQDSAKEGCKVLLPERGEEGKCSTSEVRGRRESCERGREWGCGGCRGAGKGERREEWEARWSRRGRRRRAARRGARC